MTKILTTKQLLAIAQEATKPRQQCKKQNCTCNLCPRTKHAFHKAFTPQVAIALLNKLEELEEYKFRYEGLNK